MVNKNNKICAHVAIDKDGRTGSLKRGFSWVPPRIDTRSFVQSYQRPRRRSAMALVGAYRKAKALADT